MTKQHWMAAAVFLAGLATLVGGLHDFNDALTPSFVGGVIAQVAGAIMALYAEKPGAPSA